MHYLNKKTSLYILENVVSLINTKAIMTNIQVTFNMDSEDVYIECCENQLKQVFIIFCKIRLKQCQMGEKSSLPCKKIIIMRLIFVF